MKERAEVPYSHQVAETTAVLVQEGKASVRSFAYWDLVGKLTQYIVLSYPNLRAVWNDECARLLEEIGERLPADMTPGQIAQRTNPMIAQVHERVKLPGEVITLSQDEYKLE